MRAILTATVLAFLLAACEQAPPAADRVFLNGAVYTVDADRSWAEAVAIQDGKFLVVGTNADALAVTGEGTEVVDLQGRMAMPGFCTARPEITSPAPSGSGDVSEPSNPMGGASKRRKMPRAKTTAIMHSPTHPNLRDPP